MNLLICGGRYFNDYEKLCAAMCGLPFTPSIIIQGGAKGADSLAAGWASQNEIHCATVPALWNAFDKPAGNLRNGAMLLLNVGYCLAMPGGSGTADMVRRCLENKIPTWRPYG